jgi:glycosyltransferase involved in cell wall biosynthesis
LNNLNILIISQYFHPEHFRINRVASNLIQLGYRVTVLTGKPNYPEGIFYTGFRPLVFTKSLEGGIRIFRTPIIRRGRKSKFLLFLNYLSFVLSASFFGCLKLRGERFDLVYCYAPSPITQALPAILLGRLFSAPVVLNVQDLWPQSLAASGNITNRWVLKFVGLLVAFIYQKCSLIIGSSRPFLPEIRKLAPDSVVDYLPNSADADIGVSSEILKNFQLEKSEIDKVFDTDFTCVFTGNLGKSQSLETLISAAQHLSSVPDIKIVVFGFGNQFNWLESQISALGLSNLSLMGRYPPETMPYVMSKSSCLLCCLADTEIFRMTVPNKIQAYLAAGKPIIACMVGEGAQIVLDSRAGVACRPGDGEALAGAILKLKESSASELKQFGINGKRYFKKNFDDELVMNELIKKFSQLVENK